MGPIIGIDLGTTNSVVAYSDGKDAKIIENQEGCRTTPSIVAYTKNGDRLIGDPAKRQQVTNPEYTFYAVKRLIGKKYKDMKHLQENLSYNLVEGSSGDAWVKGIGKNFSPQEISAAILLKMKETAEKHLNKTISQAVVTVPAYFNDSQRQATKDAGRIAGIEIKRIINEPTAAALAYGLDQKYKDQDKKIAVYDLGGGTFDISILEISDNVFEVISTNGDTELGGEDFDIAIMNAVLEDFKKKERYDLKSSKEALQRIKTEAEKAKKELSSTMSYDFNIPFIAQVNGQNKNIEYTLTRTKLENMVEDLVRRTIEPCKKALSDAKISAKEIDNIVLVGGMTRMPLVQKIVKGFFGQEPYKGVNPDEVVALGAATQGAILDPNVDSAHDIILLDVTPLSLGIETEGGMFTTIIPRNTTVPTKKSQTFSTAVDNQSGVTIRVFQGERKIAQNNKSLGQFDLFGIPPAPRGVPQIEVSFDIDANGILNVSAKDKVTGKQQEIRIQASGGLSEEEVKNMIDDAQKHQEEDKKKEEEIESINAAQGLLHRTKGDLEKHKDKIDEDTKKNIQSAITDLEKEVENKNIDLIKEKTQNLIQASMKLGEILYKEQNEKNDQVDSSKDDSSEQIVDGNYEEVDKKKE